jgi:hypothetical protein
MDNTELIAEARKYLKWASYFPSARELWLKKVSAAIAAIVGSSEQKQTLIGLEGELSAPPRSVVSFPGSCTGF